MAFTDPLDKFPGLSCTKLLAWAQLNLWGRNIFEDILKKKNTPNPSSNLREYIGIPNLIKEKGKKKLFVEGKLRIFEDRSYKKPKLQYSMLNTVPHLGML